MKIYIKSAFNTDKMLQEANERRTKHLFDLLDDQPRKEARDYNDSMCNYNRGRKASIIESLNTYINDGCAELTSEINDYLEEVYGSNHNRSFNEEFYIYLKDAFKKMQDDKNKFNPSSGVYTYRAFYFGIIIYNNGKVSIKSETNMSNYVEDHLWNADIEARAKQYIDEALSNIGTAMENAIKDLLRFAPPRLQ